MNRRSTAKSGLAVTPRKSTPLAVVLPRTATVAATGKPPENIGETHLLPQSCRGPAPTSATLSGSIGVAEVAVEPRGLKTAWPQTSASLTGRFCRNIEKTARIAFAESITSDASFAVSSVAFALARHRASGVTVDAIEAENTGPNLDAPDSLSCAPARSGGSGRRPGRVLAGARRFRLAAFGRRKLYTAAIQPVDVAFSLAFSRIFRSEPGFSLHNPTYQTRTFAPVKSLSMSRLRARFRRFHGLTLRDSSPVFKGQSPMRYQTLQGAL